MKARGKCMLIRTITLGIADPHPLNPEAIRRSAATLQRASARYAEAGYEVQTVRLSTRPIFDDLADWSPAALVDYTQWLQRVLGDAGVGFCSLVAPEAARPDLRLERIKLIHDLVGPTRAVNA